MKGRRIVPLVVGLLLGLLIGIFAPRAFDATAAAERRKAEARAKRAANPDAVVEHIDFKAAVAWAGGGKWTPQPFPLAELNATAEPRESASRRYLARCEQPLTADEQQTFFNRFMNHVRDSLGKRADGLRGGGVGMFPQGNALVYCAHSDFRTRESEERGTAGGVRGTLTAFMVSDGKTATLFVTLAEVLPQPD